MYQLNRRRFLGTAAAGTAAVSQVLSRAAESGTPDLKIKTGLIGCGGYGMADVRAAFKAGGVEVLAVCDVDEAHLNSTAEAVARLQGSRPRTFKQYQDLLETPGLQAVIIATPPQWHALQFIAALRRGLDVYCEKPLAYDVREAQAMAAAAARSDRIVQIGFQRRQSKAFQEVRQHLEAGHAGKIISVDVQIHYTAGIKDATPQEPPAALDWDLWCGPAPKISYSPQVGHVNWRLEKTTGHGHLVDWGIHLIDATRVILGEGAPRSVIAAGGIYHFQGKITTPDVLTAHFEFERCPVTWRHRIYGAEEYTPEVSNGILFYGEKQTVFVTDDRWVVIPRGRGKERETHEAKSDMGTVHMAEFLAAVRSRQPPGCSIGDALLSTTAVKLAMISYDTGTRVVWDEARKSIVGNEAASVLLKRPYRGPWKHPAEA